MRSRRNDVCDQRRRRVLLEENLGDTELEPDAPVPPDSDSSCSSADQFLPSYTDAALADRRSPITAVIPRRRWTLIVLLLSGLAVIAGIEAAYGKLHLWPREMWASGFAAVDVQAAGGLAAWFCSLILAVAAFQGFQIYRLRRHKTDDYRGRYRVWLWVPTLLLFMATGVATHVHRDLANLVSGLVNISTPAKGGIWPLIYCALWTLVSLRLAFEVRKNRASLVSLLAATCCYFSVALGLLFADLTVGEIGKISHVMATTAITMSGHLATFLTVAIYGRHVYLDSQGMLSQHQEKAARTKPLKRSVNEPESNEGIVEPNDAPPRPARAKVIPISTVAAGSESHDPPARPAKKRPARIQKRNSADQANPQLTVESGVEPQVSPDETGGNRKLSKAERRRLRKQKRREQRANAA